MQPVLFVIVQPFRLVRANSQREHPKDAERDRRHSFQHE
jgi:hypothetical protein